MSYTNIFGGTLVQPAYVSYRAVRLEGDPIGTPSTLVLTWPSSFLDTANVTAAFFDTSSDTDNNVIQMPPANQVSVGQPVIIRNLSDEGINIIIQDTTGSEIQQIAPGQIWYLLITNNTTDAGIWSSFQFGTGTSSADASSLAGLGLINLLGKLNIQLQVENLNSDYDSTNQDRSKFFIYTGSGVSNFTLPPIETIQNGFFFAIHNISTSGTLTILPFNFDSQIDGAAEFVLNPGDSAIFNTDSFNWYSFCHNVSNQNIINILPLNLGLISPVTLTPDQANCQIQQFFGNLTFPVTVNYRPGIPFIYYITNFTTGGFPVILTIPGSGTFINLDGNISVIVYSDGSNLYNIPTLQNGTDAFSNGVLRAPSIRFLADPYTGFYSPVAGSIAITSPISPSASEETLRISGDDFNFYRPIIGNAGIDSEAGYTESSINIYSLIRAYMNA